MDHDPDRFMFLGSSPNPGDSAGVVEGGATLDLPPQFDFSRLPSSSSEQNSAPGGATFDFLPPLDNPAPDSRMTSFPLSAYEDGDYISAETLQHQAAISPQTTVSVTPVSSLYLQDHDQGQGQGLKQGLKQGHFQFGGIQARSSSPPILDFVSGTGFAIDSPPPPPLPSGEFRPSSASPGSSAEHLFSPQGLELAAPTRPLPAPFLKSRSNPEVLRNPSSAQAPYFEAPRQVVRKGSAKGALRPAVVVADDVFSLIAQRPCNLRSEVAYYLPRKLRNAVSLFPNWTCRSL